MKRIQSFKSAFTRQFSTQLNHESQHMSRAQHDFERELLEIRREFEGLDPIGSVRLDKNDETGVATIKLTNEGRRNGLSGRMMSQLYDCVTQLQQWPRGKAVIISGENDFFCSGGDLNLVRRIANQTQGRKMSLLMQSTFTRLQALPLISLAAIRGMALGGGAEITTACDLRVMSDCARVGFVHIRIGIVSAWGGASRLCGIVGHQRALEMMLSGRTLGAKEAKEAGFVDDVLEGGGDWEERAERWLREKFLLDNSCETIRAVKKIINGSKYLPLELSLREELESSSTVWGKEEHRRKLIENVKHNQ